MRNYSYFCIRKGSFPLKEILRTAQATILGAGVSPGRKGSQKSTLFYLSGNIFNPSNRPWLAYIFRDRATYHNIDSLRSKHFIDSIVKSFFYLIIEKYLEMFFTFTYIP